MGLGNGAAGMKTAAGRQVDGVGRFPLQNDALAAQTRVGHGHDGEERFGLGVVRLWNGVKSNSDCPAMASWLRILPSSEANLKASPAPTHGQGNVGMLGKRVQDKIPVGWHGVQAGFGHDHGAMCRGKRIWALISQSEIHQKVEAHCRGLQFPTFYARANWPHQCESTPH